MKTCRSIFVLAILLFLPQILIKAENELITERVRLHVVEKEIHLGDTISFSGKIMSNDSTDRAYSRYAYVEIIGRNDSVLIRKKYRCSDDGSFGGKLFIEKQWREGIYYLRGYTRLMQNYSPSCFYIQPLAIDCQLMRAEEKISAINCHFFPEGGNFVVDTPQNVVVYLTDANGFPIRTSFEIMDGKDTLKVARSNDSGMALVPVTLSRWRNQTLHVAHDGYSHTFPFPESDGVKPTLQAQLKGSRINYSVIGNSNSTSLRLFGYHDYTGIQELKLSDQQVGSLDWTGLPLHGIFILFLMNDNHEIIAERCVLLDSFTGNDIPIHCDDVTSPIPLRNNFSSKDVQIWMATSRFQRMDLSKLLTSGFNYTYPLENVLTIKGQLTDQHHRPITKASVSAYNRNSFSSSTAETDENGFYTLVLDDFQDGEEWFISAETGKNKMDYDSFLYNIKEDHFPPVVIPHRARVYLDSGNTETVISEQPYYFSFEELNKLPEITVKAKYRELSNAGLNEKNFYGVRYVPVAEMENQFVDFKSIVDRIPTIELTKVVFNGRERYQLTNTRGINNEVTIMLDGTYITPEMAWYLDPNQLEDVVLLTANEALPYTTFAYNGLLRIRTRQSGTLRAKRTRSKGIWYLPLGISNFE